MARLVIWSRANQLASFRHADFDVVAAREQVSATSRSILEGASATNQDVM
jgi:hypothetical protein